MSSNSNNFNKSSFKNDGNVTINIGASTSHTMTPINPFCQHKFIETVNIMKKVYDEGELELPPLKRNMEKKNELNQVGEFYYKTNILPNLKDNFFEIDSLLKQPRFEKLAENYTILGRALTQNYLSLESNLPSLTEHIELISEVIYTKHMDKLIDFGVDIVSITLHHMYYYCFYGIREE